MVCVLLPPDRVCEAIDHLQMRKRNQDTLFARPYTDDNAAQQFFG
jgi:hypothetical protein